MKPYFLSDKDIVAISRLLELGGEMASVNRDSVNFEVGILSERGYMPKAYGSGNTIADAINEAIGSPSGSASDVTPAEIDRVKNWLRKNKEKVPSVDFR
jgi:hypothetical protein